MRTRLPGSALSVFLVELLFLNIQYILVILGQKFPIVKSDESFDFHNYGNI